MMQKVSVLLPQMVVEKIIAHFSAINSDGFKSLREAQRVTFEITNGPKGKQASNIRPE